MERSNSNNHGHKVLKTISDGESDETRLVDIDQLKRLVRLLDQSDVSEIELKRASEGLRLVLRKPVMNEEVTGQTIAAIESVEASEPVETQGKVVAPLVGLFHPWAKPKGKPVINVGDRIKVGQTVATIESLNVLNDVESPLSGQVVEVLVQDGQPVEYGQPLMVVEQSEEA